MRSQQKNINIKTKIIASNTGRSADVKKIGELMDEIQLMLQIFKEYSKGTSPINTANGIKTSIPRAYRKGLKELFNKMVDLQQAMDPLLQTHK